MVSGYFIGGMGRCLDELLVISGDEPVVISPNFELLSKLEIILSVVVVVLSYSYLPSLIYVFVYLVCLSCVALPVSLNVRFCFFCKQREVLL